MLGGRADRLDFALAYFFGSGLAPHCDVLGCGLPQAAPIGPPVQLHEFEGKALLARGGIPVPGGQLIRDPAELSTLSGPVALKVQILAGGRGKAGGIRFAETLGEAREAARILLGKELLGRRVSQLLVEERLAIAKEYYLALLIDRQARGYLLLASQEGGVDIEAVPDAAVHRIPIDPLIGLQPYMLRALTRGMGLPPRGTEALRELVPRLYHLFLTYQCEVLEINPLVWTTDGRLLAADARVLIDDRTVDRFPEIQQDDRGQTPFDRAAQALGVYAIAMAGDIAVITAGAGVLMATMDAVQRRGGTLAAAMDMGGIVGYDLTLASKAIALMAGLRPKVLLFNYFFQVMRGDVLAQAILEARAGTSRPRVVVRLKGKEAPAGRALLRDAGIPVTEDFDEACAMAVEAAGGGDGHPRR